VECRIFLRKKFFRHEEEGRGSLPSKRRLQEIALEVGGTSGSTLSHKAPFKEELKLLIRQKRTKKGRFSLNEKPRISYRKREGASSPRGGKNRISRRNLNTEKRKGGGTFDPREEEKRTSRVEENREKEGGRRSFRFMVNGKSQFGKKRTRETLRILSDFLRCDRELFSPLAVGRKPTLSFSTGR